MNALEHPLERRELTIQVLRPSWRQLVRPDATTRPGDVPLRPDEPRFQHSLECGVQGSFLDLQEIVRGSPDVLYERVAVRRLASQDLENHDLQSAWKQTATFS